MRLARGRGHTHAPAAGSTAASADPSGASAAARSAVEDARGDGDDGAGMDSRDADTVSAPPGLQYSRGLPNKLQVIFSKGLKDRQKVERRG